MRRVTRPDIRRTLVPSLPSVRVVRLEPDPIDAEILQVAEVEIVHAPAVGVLGAGTVGQVLDRAARGEISAGGLDVEDVQLIHPDVAGLDGGNRDGVVATAVRGIPEPISARARLVAGRQAIGAGLGSVDRRGVVAAARVGHRVGLVIRVGVGDADRVAVGRDDAVGNTIAVGVAVGAVAVVQVAEEFDRGDIARVGRERDGDRYGVARDLVHVKFRRGVIAVQRAVALGRYGKPRGAHRACGERHNRIGVGRVVARPLFLAIRAVPETDAVTDRGEHRDIAEDRLPAHRFTRHAVVLLQTLVGEVDDLRVRIAGVALRTDRRGSIRGVIKRTEVGTAEKEIVRLVRGRITDERAENHVRTADRTVVAVIDPGRTVAQRERLGLSRGLVGRHPTASVVAVDIIGAGDSRVEGQPQVILHHARSGGTGHGVGPKLVVAVVAMERQVVAAPRSIGSRPVKDCPTVLIGRSVARVVEFPDSAVNGEGTTRGDLVSRRPHGVRVDQRFGVGRTVPSCGQDGGSSGGHDKTEIEASAGDRLAREASHAGHAGKHLGDQLRNGIVGIRRTQEGESAGNDRRGIRCAAARRVGCVAGIGRGPHIDTGRE